MKAKSGSEPRLNEIDHGYKIPDKSSWTLSKFDRNDAREKLMQLNIYKKVFDFFFLSISKNEKKIY